jgi:hypothetical protein
MRTHPCVRLFCIIDTLTSASMLPGIDRYIEELPEKSRLHRSRPHAQYVKATRGAAWLGRSDWALCPHFFLRILFAHSSSFVR